MKIKNKGIFIIFLLSVTISIAVFPNLPNQIPIHWNINGTIDDYGSKYTIFMEPVLIFIIWFLMDIFKNIDPKRDNYKKFGKEYAHFKLAICLLILAMQIFTIAVIFGHGIKMDVLVPLFIGLLFTYIGNLMPKLKFNYFMGIKTPWTLHNEHVWFQTHRLAGKIWFAGGLFMALSSFLPAPANFIVFMIIALILVLIPSIYSYLLYQKTA